MHNGRVICDRPRAVAVPRRCSPRVPRRAALALVRLLRRRRRRRRRRPAPTPAASSRAADEPYLPVPDGVELTAQGTELDVRRHRDGRLRAAPGRRSASLDVTVTRLEQGRARRLRGLRRSTTATRKTDAVLRRASTVKNVGEDRPRRRRRCRCTASTATTPCSQPVDVHQQRSSRARPSRCPRSSSPATPSRPAWSSSSPDKGDARRRSASGPTEEFDPITWTGDDQPAPSDRSPKKGDKKKQGRQGRRRLSRFGRADRRRGQWRRMTARPRAARARARVAARRRPPWCSRRWRASPTRPTAGSAPSRAPASTSAR